MPTAAWIRRWLRRCLYVAVGAFCLLLLTAVILQAPPGKMLLAKSVSGLVARSTSLRLEIHGITGLLPRHIRIESVEVDDPRGDLVTLHDVDLRLCLSQLLRRRIRVEQLDIGRIDLWKRPIPRQKWRLPRIPALPVWPDVRDLRVHNLTLGEEVVGRVVSLAVSGSIRPVAGEVFPEAALEIVGLHSEATKGTLSFTYDQGLPQILLQVNDAVLLPGLLDVPAPLVADLEGRGVRADWQGNLQVNAGADTLLKGEARFMEGDATTLQAHFALDASKTPFLRDHTTVYGEKIEGRLALSLDTQGLLEIQSCEIMSDTVNADMEGTVQIEQKATDLRLQAAHQDISRIPGIRTDTGVLPGKMEAVLQGPFSGMVAVVQASVNDAPVLDARVGSAVQLPLPLEGVITLFPGRLPLEELPFEDDAAVELSFDLSYDRLAGEARVDRFDIAGAGVQVSTRGTLASDPPGANLTGRLAADDLGHVPWLPARPLAGAVNADFKVETGESGLTFSLDAAGTGLKAATVTAVDMTARLEGRCRDWTVLPPVGMTLGFNSEIRGLVFSGQEPTDWKAEVQADTDDSGDVQLRSVLLTDGNARVDGHGMFNSAAGTLDLALQCAVASLQDLPPWVESMPDGRLQASVNASGTLRPLALKADATGSLEALKELPEPLAALSGDALNLALAFSAAGDNIEVSSMTLTGASLSAEGSAVYNRDDGGLEANAKVNLADLKPLAESLGTSGGGTASIDAHLQGTSAALVGRADIRGTDIVMGGISATRIDATLEGDDLTGSKPGITLTAVAKTGGSEVMADAVIVPGGGTVDVSSFSIRVGDNRISGRATVAPGKEPIEAEANADLNDLAALGSFAGVSIGGSSEGTVSIRDGAIKADIRGRSLVYGNSRAKDLNATIRMKEGKSGYDGTATILSKGVKVGTLLAEEVEIVLEGGLEEAGIQVRARGALDGAAAPGVSLKMAGRVFSKDRKMMLTEVQGALGDFDFGLEEPAEIGGGKGAVALTPTNLRFGSGNLVLEGRQEKDSISARLHMDSFPLAAAALFGQPGLSGVLGGDIVLKGTLAAPTGTISLKVTEARLVSGTAEMPAPLSATLETVLNPGECSATLKADMQDVLHLESEIRLPVGLRLDPWSWDLPSGTGLSGKAQFEVHTRQLFPALGLVEHYLDGTAVGSFTVSGGIAAPDLRGEVVMGDARYENSRTGTRLENLNVRITAENGALTLTECTATTGDKGGMTVSGEMALLYERQFPFSVTVRFDDARFADLEYLDGQMNGSVKAEGTLQDILVTGAVKVSPVEVSIPEELPVREPAALEVTEIKDGKVVNREQEKVPGFGKRVRLDIDCEIPGKAYARAPILDSEWGGKLHVGGTLAAMKIDGRIAVRRGHMDFLNRRFVLRDSALLFLDGSPEKPYLDMQAVVETPNLSARLTLKGELDDVKMELSSDPMLPQDEILAQILFGRNLSRLSPVQAIQLARVAAMFNHGFAGVPLFSGNINLPGIDRIDLRTGERADETAVGVGKYLTDSVYVEVEQGTTTSSGKVSVEVEVTPQISVKGDADAKERSGVGLFWKKDY